MMIFFSNAFNALEQLVTHRMRSLLTILAIVIAVTATITVVSVVQGFTRYVSNFLEGLGTNAVFVAPQRPAGEAGKSLGRVELDEKDFRAIESQCSALRRVSPWLPRQNVKLRNGRDEITISVEGVAPSYHTVRNFPVDVGRPFAVVDVERAQQVCVVGREILRKFDLDEEIVGGNVLLDGRRFRVIGILASKGSFFGQSLDDVVLIPYTTALKMYPLFRRNMVVAAQAVTAEAVPEAKAQITNLLRRRHALAPHQPNDFIVQTQGEILAAFNNVGTAAVSVLAGIVGISLLVGGIGIMNVMLVSVTERTREIGLRKAVGARRRDIMWQFLTEAMTLSLIGGGLGIALGYALSTLASLHPRMVDVVVPVWAVLLGFGISAGTGVVFGIVPALKAALLNPIDALRHE
jgi:putative ABC transport system permease protein